MELRDRIIEETTTMFAKSGIKAVRMDDIAEQMGISKRTIYELFCDKEALIIECMGYLQVRMNERNKEVMSGASNIIEEFIALLEVWDLQVEIYYNLATDIRKYYPKLHSRLSGGHAQEIHDKLKKRLEESVAQGYLMDNVNLDLAITVLGYSVFGVVKQNAILPHNVSEREAFKYVITYFLRGIATPKGIKIMDDYYESKLKMKNEKDLK